MSSIIKFNINDGIYKDLKQGNLRSTKRRKKSLTIIIGTVAHIDIHKKEKEFSAAAHAGGTWAYKLLGEYNVAFAISVSTKPVE